MSSRDRKHELRAIREARARDSAVMQCRHPHDDISYPGAGLLLVQLLKAPSFQKTTAWEVRELNEGLSLFWSESPHPDDYLLAGHVRLDIEAEALSECIAPLRSMAVPIFPTMPRFGVADGTRLEACFGVGFGTAFRACWMEGHAPAEWLPLVRLASSLIARFESLTAAIDEPPAV
jgi:hypothetical protein